MVTTIYKYIKEQLRVEKEVGVEPKLEIFFDDEPLEFKEKNNTTTQVVNVDQEEFNEYLKNKKKCFVLRETFVIEHDTEKNKIIFKKYDVKKHSVLVKKINKNHLKVFKAYTSLTLDIKTGEFSLYQTAKNSRGLLCQPVIRQTQFTSSFFYRLNKIFESTIDNVIVEDGINKVLKLLGYSQNISNFLDDSIIRMNYRDSHKEIRLNDRFTFFLIFNYFNLNNIQIPDKNFILEYAYNFNLNKKLYFGKTVYHYYADFLGMDVSFIKSIYDYKNMLNYWVYANNKEKINWFDETANGSKNREQDYYSINPYNLAIVYKLGFYASEIIGDHRLIDFVFIKSSKYENQYYINSKVCKKIPFDILEKHKVFFRELIFATINTSKDSVFSLLMDLKRLKNIYGLSVDPNIIYHTNINLIFSSLDLAVLHTGLYVVSKTFLNKLKKTIAKEKLKIGFATKDKEIYKFNPVVKKFEMIIADKLVQTSTNMHAQIELRDNKNQLIAKIWVYPDSIQHTKFRKKNEPDYIEFTTPKEKTETFQGRLINLAKKFDMSHDQLKYSGLKAVYSKKSFENFMAEKYSEKNLESVMKGIVYLK